MKKIILSLLLCCFSIFSKADGGAPNIYAFVNITLHSGEQIEGAMVVANGGYGCTYLGNGFTFSKENSIEQQTVLFNTDFTSLLKMKQNYEQEGFTKMKFANSTSYNCYEKESYTWDSKKKMLVATPKKNIQYELLDYLLLTLDLNLIGNSKAYKNEAYHRKIKLSDIKDFKIIRHPKMEIINELADAKKEYRKNDIFENSPLPIWFHEILNSQNSYNEVKDWDTEHSFLLNTIQFPSTDDTFYITKAIENLDKTSFKKHPITVSQPYISITLTKHNFMGGYKESILLEYDRNIKHWKASALYHFFNRKGGQKERLDSFDNIQPKSSWRELLQILLDNNIATIKDRKELDYKEDVADGTGYTLQFVIGKYMREIQYNNPKYYAKTFPDIKELRNLLAIINSIESNIKIPIKIPIKRP